MIDIYVEVSGYLDVSQDIFDLIRDWPTPRIEYLLEHGSLENVTRYYKADTFTTVFKFSWSLEPKRETLYYLNHGDRANVLKFA